MVVNVGNSSAFSLKQTQAAGVMDTSSENIQVDCAPHLSTGGGGGHLQPKECLRPLIKVVVCIHNALYIPSDVSPRPTVSLSYTLTGIHSPRDSEYTGATLSLHIVEHSWWRIIRWEGESQARAVQYRD